MYDRQQLLRAFRIGFVSLLLGGIAVGLFREGLAVDAAVTGLGIGIAAVVPVAMIVAAVLLVLALTDRWSTKQA